MSATQAPGPFATLLADYTFGELTTLMTATIEEVRHRLVADPDAPTLVSLLARDRPRPTNDTPSRLRRSARPPVDKTRLRLVK